MKWGTWGAFASAVLIRPAVRSKNPRVGLGRHGTPVGRLTPGDAPLVRLGGDT